MTAAITEQVVWVGGVPQVLVMETTQHDCRCRMRESRTRLRPLTEAEQAALSAPRDGRHE